MSVCGDEWQGKGYSFFENRACECFPCHAWNSGEDFNCLFCYCPLYLLGEKCGGNYTILRDGTKDCSGCLLPHRRGNYGYILEKFQCACEEMKKNASKGSDKASD